MTRNDPQTHVTEANDPQSSPPAAAEVGQAPSVPSPVEFCGRCGRELLVCGWCGSYRDQHPVTFGNGEQCHGTADEWHREAEPALVQTMKGTRQSWDYPGDDGEWELRCRECSG